MGRRCFQCRRKCKHLSWCGKCKHATYCSKKCQDHHWRIHQKVCCPPDLNPAVEEVENTEFHRSFSEILDFAQEFGHVATVCRSCRLTPNPTCRFVSILKIDWTAGFSEDNITLVCCFIAQAFNEIQRGKSTFKSACPLMPICVRHCRGCDQISAKTKKCAICRHVWYCTRECQRKDWARHKLTCTMRYE